MYLAFSKGIRTKQIESDEIFVKNPPFRVRGIFCVSCCYTCIGLAFSKIIGFALSSDGSTSYFFIR